MKKTTQLKRFIASFISLGILCGCCTQASAEKSTDLSGLNVGQTTILYDSSIGMPTSEANTVVQTSDGFFGIGTNDNVWVLSSNGIYVVDAAELMANGDSILYTLYNSDSGLPHVATANSRNYMDEKGNLFIAGTTGSNTDEEVAVTIIKEKAIYEYRWFNLLIIACIAALVILFISLHFRRKNQALLRKQAETREFINQITQAFAKCIDAKDRYTNGHSFRVANYTRMLAQKMGYSESDVEDIYNTALLHDIGKLSIPDAILNKPEGLDDDEYAIMKSHAEKGYQILQEIKIAPDLAIGAGYHHERLDGKGYPIGYKGDEIPMVAQIIAVADTFDAMYSTRPYRKKMPIQTVLDELHRVAGTQLNADIVDKLQELKDEGAIQ